MQDSMLRRSPDSAKPITAVLGVAMILLSAGCGGSAPEQSIAPLGTETDGPAAVPTSGRGPATTGVGGSGNPTDPTDMTPQGQIADLLGRFDDAISALHAVPAAAADDSHPLSRAWLEVVVGGSQLDRQVRGRIRAAATDDNMAVVPDADGTSFRNVALEVTPQPDGSLTWVNCGYAPGVGIDLDTGEVVDDNRTSTRGRGRAVPDAGGELMVSELWDDESRLLRPAESDPCADLVATADPVGGAR